MRDLIHVCPNCGLKMDRDLSAAKNISLQLSREPREVTPMEISPLLPKPRASKRDQPNRKPPNLLGGSSLRM